MVRYELLKFAHVAAVIIWLGAGFLFTLQIYFAARAEDRGRQMGYFREIGELSLRLFIPASLLTPILGILLVIDGPFRWEDVWVQIGLAGYIVSFLLGFFYFRTEGPRIGALAQERGPDDPEVSRRVQRMTAVDRLQLLILFLMVADMTIKPTTEVNEWALTSGAVILGLALILTTFSLWRGRPATA